MNERPGELSQLQEPKKEIDPNDLFENFDSWCQIHFKRSQKKQQAQTPSVVRSLSALFDRMEQNNYPPSPTLPKTRVKKVAPKKLGTEQLYGGQLLPNTGVTKVQKPKLSNMITLDEEDSKTFDRHPRIKGVESVKGHTKVILATNRSSLAGYPQQKGHYELGTTNKPNHNPRSISCR